MEITEQHYQSVEIIVTDLVTGKAQRLTAPKTANFELAISDSNDDFNSFKFVNSFQDVRCSFTIVPVDGKLYSITDE